MKYLFLLFGIINLSGFSESSQNMRSFNNVIELFKSKDYSWQIEFEDNLTLMDQGPCWDELIPDENGTRFSGGDVEINIPLPRLCKYQNYRIEFHLKKEVDSTSFNTVLYKTSWGKVKPQDIFSFPIKSEMDSNNTWIFSSEFRSSGQEYFFKLAYFDENKLKLGCKESNYTLSSVEIREQWRRCELPAEQLIMIKFVPLNREIIDNIRVGYTSEGYALINEVLDFQ